MGCMARVVQPIFVLTVTHEHETQSAAFPGLALDLLPNLQPADALPLADCFDNMVLGHAHKPYIVPTKRVGPIA